MAGPSSCFEVFDSLSRRAWMTDSLLVEPLGGSGTSGLRCRIRPGLRYLFPSCFVVLAQRSAAKCAGTAQLESFCSLMLSLLEDFEMWSDEHLHSLSGRQTVPHSRHATFVGNRTGQKGWNTLALRLLDFSSAPSIVSLLAGALIHDSFRSLYRALGLSVGTLLGLDPDVVCMVPRSFGVLLVKDMRRDLHASVSMSPGIDVRLQVRSRLLGAVFPPMTDRDGVPYPLRLSVSLLDLLCAVVAHCVPYGRMRIIAEWAGLCAIGRGL
ncbi:hypothetical protein KC343_g52 [Hortaea werneckii]|nr:hypothetical protein KC317_g51 [Hortaea werneckii]KAI7628660.1 hypothetical protein KC346_g55 [Hortaea werneckii]KAI7638496.1 hypothetical protein KC343_g52 [Hortaea werneckii]